MVLQDQLSLNAGQKYCRMHSAILSTYIKLPHGFKTFFVYFEWQIKTGFTVLNLDSQGYFQIMTTFSIFRQHLEIQEKNYVPFNIIEN